MYVRSRRGCLVFMELANRNIDNLYRSCNERLLARVEELLR